MFDILLYGLFLISQLLQELHVFLRGICGSLPYTDLLLAILYSDKYYAQPKGLSIVIEISLSHKIDYPSSQVSHSVSIINEYKRYFETESRSSPGVKTGFLHVKFSQT